MRNLMIVLVVLSLSVGTVIGSDPEDWGSFEELCSGSSVEYLEMSRNPLHQLKIRTDPNDSSGSSDIIVPDIGFWEIGFLKETIEGWVFGGYATTDTSFHNQVPGWMLGYFYSPIFSTGDIPNDLQVVHDVDFDGVGNSVPDGNGGHYFDAPGDDGEAYDSWEVLFGEEQLRGDLFEIAAITFDGTLEVLPLMVICEYRPYDAIYLDGVRSDSSGIVDLLRMGEYWLTSGHSKTDYYAEGADWDRSGTVNLLDFAQMAAKWNPAEAEEF